MAATKLQPSHSDLLQYSLSIASFNLTLTLVYSRILPWLNYEFRESINLIKEMRQST